MLHHRHSAFRTTGCSYEQWAHGRIDQSKRPSSTCRDRSFDGVSANLRTEDLTQYLCLVKNIGKKALMKRKNKMTATFLKMNSLQSTAKAHQRKRMEQMDRFDLGDGHLESKPSSPQIRPWTLTASWTSRPLHTDIPCQGISLHNHVSHETSARSLPKKLTF